VLSLPLGFKDGYQATKLAYAYYKKFQPNVIYKGVVPFLVSLAVAATLLLYISKDCNMAA